jgi:hypothetical protein
MSSISESPDGTDLTYGKIFKFWSPLALTWLMMAIEGPFLAAIIARMPEAKINLASYGVAFSFALIFEAPIIMITSASTALVKDRISFIKLRNFTYACNVILTLLMFLISTPFIFDVIALKIMNLPPDAASIAQQAAFALLPWPGMIGVRRFNNGINISSGQTHLVAYGTVIRISAMAGAALILHALTDMHGAVIGTCALSSGVTTEAIASTIMTNKARKQLLATERTSHEPIRYRGIFNFYYPLAITSILTMGIGPMVTFFMGQSRYPLESLAVLPVINGLTFLFNCFGISYQEVTIAMLGAKNRYRTLLIFGRTMGITTSVLFGLLAFTPLAHIWLVIISGLTEELASFAELPLRVNLLLPGLTVLVSFQRAILVRAYKTKIMTISTIIEFVLIFVWLFVTIHFFSFIGAVAAMSSVIFGRMIASFYAKKYIDANLRSLQGG